MAKKKKEIEEDIEKMGDKERTELVMGCVGGICIKENSIQFNIKKKDCSPEVMVLLFQKITEGKPVEWKIEATEEEDEDKDV